MPSPKTPRLFRVLVGARDLEESSRFYETLLAVRGRKVAEGRIYFDCGAVILGVLDISGQAPGEWAAPTEAIYLSVGDLETVHRQAERLGCLSEELLHGDPASPLGEIVVRPWGERSFYAVDPAGNSLCFVAAGTEFTGTPGQVRSLAGRSKARARS